MPLHTNMKNTKSNFIPTILKLTFVFIAIISVYAQKTLKEGTIIELTNCYDAFGNDQADLVQDFGFSCLVKYQGKTILFDAGTDANTFLRNVETLKIDLGKVDIAILSHGHYDHMGGFDILKKQNPNVKIYVPNDFFSLGAPVKFPFRDAEPDIVKTMSTNEIYFGGKKVVDGMVTVPTGRFWEWDVSYVKVAEEILPGITLVPTTAELMGTYIKYPPFDKNPKFIGMPELSVSFRTPKGQVIITGCSHSTIETIIQETKKVCPEDILLVAGGFHLIPYDRAYIEGLAVRMRDTYRVANVAPGHCTGHLGFSIFKNTFVQNYQFFGLGEKLSF